MELPYIGMVKLVSRKFDSPGWFVCEGQTLPISQYDRLFSLIGTTYGGDGRTTFKLPDMRDPANPGHHKGFGSDQPLKYIICLQGIYPTRY